VGGFLAASGNAMIDEGGIGAGWRAAAGLTLAGPMRLHADQVTRTGLQAGPCP